MPGSRPGSSASSSRRLPEVGVTLGELKEMLPVPSGVGLWLQSVSEPGSHDSETGVAVPVPLSHADAPVPVTTLRGRVIVPPSVVGRAVQDGPAEGEPAGDGPDAHGHGLTARSGSRWHPPRPRARRCRCPAGTAFVLMSCMSTSEPWVDGRNPFGVKVGSFMWPAAGGVTERIRKDVVLGMAGRRGIEVAGQLEA